MGKRDENHLEQDIRVGVALGAGLSYEKAAALLDVAINTILHHSKCPKALELKSLATAAMTAQVERRVEDSREEWLKEIRKRRGKHIALADRLVEKAEDPGADADLILKAMKATGDLHDRDPEASKSQKIEHEHTGEVTERHILELDPHAVAAFQLAVKEVKQLYGEVEPIIDGELAE